ncbi:MAG TPA: hypothetical protein DIT13_04210 [Verrucomicrobiales bacterium]|nr:hypothetical protein [Verrucomicrobiales bacterium]HRJ07114.1 hypothetical protein [Prosthecobacter sp.]HRK12865.1 hypothetical protein [Prosthecobacter sp.]
MKNPILHIVQSVLVLGFMATMGDIRAQDVFTPFAGSYQGLLVDSTSGDPAGRVEIALTSKGALSTTFTMLNQKTYKAAGKAAFDEVNDWAELENFNVVKPKAGPPPLSFVINLYLKKDGTFELTGAAELPGYTGSFTVEAGTASKLRFYKAKTDDCPWMGTYTLAFPDADDLGSTPPPGGVCIGSAVIKPDGVLALKGTLADGTKITASARPSQDGIYRFHILVHKTIGSYFAFWFQLTARGDGWFHSAEGDGWARWSKAENQKDKTYRDGFDVEFETRVTQWKPPGKGETLQGILGMGDDQVLDIAFFNGLNTTTYAKFLPSQLGITAKNIFRVAAGLSGSPSPLYPEQWAKVFSGKIDPKTGLMTLVLNIQDTVTTGTLPKLTTKTIKRKVVINGVYQQLMANDLLVPYAYGHLLIPPLDPKTQTLISGGFDLPGPVELDPFVASAGQTAGIYSAKLTEQPHPSPPPSGLPPVAPASVTFSISSNLKEMIFNGRKLPLKGDSRPVSLVYTDADKSAGNNVSVTVYLNGAGVVNSLATQYFQLSGFTVKVRNHTSNAVNKQP